MIWERDKMKYYSCTMENTCRSIPILEFYALDLCSFYQLNAIEIIVILVESCNDLCHAMDEFFTSRVIFCKRILFSTNLIIQGEILLFK